MHKNQLKAGASLSYLSIIITIVVISVYTPIMLRLLGQSEYGLYSLIGSVIGYLSILDMGLGNATIRYNARNRAIGDTSAEEALNGMFLMLYSGIGVLTIILGIVLYLNIGNIFGNSLNLADLEKAKVMTKLLVINFAVSFPLSIFGSIIIAYEKFVFVKILAIARTLLLPCITLPFLIAGFGSVAMVAVTVVVNLCALLINFTYCIKVLNVRIRFIGFAPPLLKEIAGYSFFIFLNVIVDKVYWSTGQFILGIISGTLAVAVYAIAMQFVTIYIMFSTAVSGVLLPKVTMMVAHDIGNFELSSLMIKVGRVQYVVLAYILSGFILFGKAFINVWAGPGYSETYFIVLLVMIPLTIPLIQNVGILILQAQNRNLFRSVIFLGIAFLNIIISIPMANLWGGLGCAATTGVCLIIGNIVIMNIYYNNKIGLTIRKFWIEIVTISIPIVVLLIIGIGFNAWVPNISILTVSIKIMTFSVAYVLVMWFFALNAFEKELIKSSMRKVIKTIWNNSEGGE